MAITYNTTSGVGSGTGITGTQSWSHGAAASLVGGAGVVIVGGGVEETTGVTYGGGTMTRIATGVNASGESGTCSVWWIANDDAGWPGSGTQTVQVTRSGSTAYIAQCFTVLTASGTSADVLSPTQNIGWDIGNSLSISNIATSLTIPNGVAVFLLGGLYSGENALSSITDDASLTRANSADFGNFTGVINRRTAIYTGTGSALTTFAWTQSSDDGAWAVVAVNENAALTTQTGNFTASAIVRKTLSYTYGASAVVQKTFAPTFTTSATVSKTWPGSFAASSLILKTQPGAFALSADFFATNLRSLDASALISRTWEISGTTLDAFISSTTLGSFTASALIHEEQTGSFTVDALLAGLGTGSFTVDAQVFATVEGSFAISAEVAGLVVSPTWVSPADTTTMSSTPTLVFTTPTLSKSMHFHIQLDKVNTFDGVDLRDIKSNFDVTGWEYWDGDSWEPLPVTGMPQAFGGNDARYTVQTSLTTGIWYRRVRAG